MSYFLRAITLFVASIWLGSGMAQQTVQILAKPGTGFVLDNAGMLTTGQIGQINHIADGAKRSVDAPIVVVTIPSLASVGAHDTDWYATTLFNAWQIGDRKTNRGVLLLVARDDRKARIELGAGWGYTRDADCQKIMDGWIIPRFKQGNFGEGILMGVEAIDSMVRTGKVPSPPTPVWVWPGIGGLATFLFFLVRDLIRNGMNAWGGRFLRGSGRTIVYILSNSRTSSSSGSSSSSGFSGGGSSGGGGASGSW